uniref:Uncharacterized protein n=1 Tax=Anopheles arabiensis TaxID=7173 RepID=A0A182IBM0_ANOAR
TKTTRIVRVVPIVYFHFSPIFCSIPIIFRIQNGRQLWHSPWAGQEGVRNGGRPHPGTGFERLHDAAGGLHADDSRCSHLLLSKLGRFRGCRSPNRPVDFDCGPKVCVGCCQRCAAALQNAHEQCAELRARVVQKPEPEIVQRSQVHAYDGRFAAGTERLRHNCAQSALFRLGREGGLGCVCACKLRLEGVGCAREGRGRGLEGGEGITRNMYLYNILLKRKW